MDRLAVIPFSSESFYQHHHWLWWRHFLRKRNYESLRATQQKKLSFWVFVARKTILLYHKPFRSIFLEWLHLTFSDATHEQSRITIPSRILRPCIKAIWVGLTTWSATELTLIVAVLVKILKLTFRRHIGLYCWILSASLTFGNKIILPKF